MLLRDYVARLHEVCIARGGYEIPRIAINYMELCRYRPVTQAYKGHVVLINPRILDEGPSIHLSVTFTNEQVNFSDFCKYAKVCKKIKTSLCAIKKLKIYINVMDVNEIYEKLNLKKKVILIQFFHSYDFGFYDGCFIKTVPEQLPNKLQNHPAYSDVHCEC